MRKLRFLLIVVLASALIFSLSSGRFLLIDNPQPADVIVVLAGETDQRPRRALELLARGYAHQVILDVPADAKVFGVTTQQIAGQYVSQLPQRESVSICPIFGLSTKTEAPDSGRCIAKTGAHKVLLVTSDYHTRRALSTFQHELPQYQFYVAAARDPRQFGIPWWERRQWAKLNLDEWLRLVWWELVDRWR
jgi:uncharacterized SAM-binding protein YcdF (DUF218 family)